MFRFSDYPEIENARKERIRLTNLAFKAEIRSTRRRRFNREKHDKLWEQALERQFAYINEKYAKIVFDTFAPLKPDLTSVQIGAVYTWDELYGDDFSVLSDSMKQSLPLLVEEEYPYRLPEKYYYDKETEMEIRRRANEKSDKAARILKGVKYTLIAIAAIAAGAFLVWLLEGE